MLRRVNCVGLGYVNGVMVWRGGVFVTAAMAPHADLVGARLVAVGETQIEDVLDMLEPLVPRDGPATVPSFRPMYLLRAIVLRGLGIAGDGAVRLSECLPQAVGAELRGTVTRVTLAAGDISVHWASFPGFLPDDVFTTKTPRKRPGNDTKK